MAVFSVSQDKTLSTFDTMTYIFVYYRAFSFLQYQIIIFLFLFQSAAVKLKVFDPLWKFPTWQQCTANEITAHNRAQLSQPRTLPGVYKI